MKCPCGASLRESRECQRKICGWIMHEALEKIVRNAALDGGNPSQDGEIAQMALRESKRHMTEKQRDALWGLILMPFLLPVVAFLVGTVIDTVAQKSDQHDRCLKQATNGYEIRECR